MVQCGRKDAAEFESQHPCKNLGVAWCTSITVGKRRDPWGLLATRLLQGSVIDLGLGRIRKRDTVGDLVSPVHLDT